MKSVVFIFLFVFLISGIYAFAITEVELNPEGTDSGSEWIELYNSGEINLSGYKIVNNDGDEIELNGSFKGYYIYIFSSQWLDNSDEKIFLYNGSGLIDETDVFEDSDNDDLTWQICDKEWVFLNSTKAEENECPEKSPEKDEVLEEEESEDDGVNKTLVENTKKEDPGFQKTSQDKEPETINLNPQVIKTEENTEHLKVNYALYGFVAVSIFVVVVFLAKNYRRGEF